jgi:hypothetical protein
MKGLLTSSGDSFNDGMTTDCDNMGTCRDVVVIFYLGATQFRGICCPNTAHGLRMLCAAPSSIPEMRSWAWIAFASVFDRMVSANTLVATAASTRKVDRSRDRDDIALAECPTSP